MTFQITFTDRFQKHYGDLTETEKKQLRSKLALLSENPMHPSLRTKRIQGMEGLFECRSTWISASSGIMRARP